MATALGARPSNAPLPLGVPAKKRGADYGTVVMLGVGNWIWAGPANGGDGGNVGNFNRPERFCLRASGNFIHYGDGGTSAVVVGLWLVVNGGYGNDLNGIGKYEQYLLQHGSWASANIEALFYCEANTNYDVYLIQTGKPSSVGNSYYYQANYHWNMWAYTIGEGVY